MCEHPLFASIKTIVFDAVQEILHEKIVCKEPGNRGTREICNEATDKVLKLITRSEEAYADVRTLISQLTSRLEELAEKSWNSETAEQIKRLGKELGEEKVRTTQLTRDLNQYADTIADMRNRIGIQNADLLLNDKTIKERLAQILDLRKALSDRNKEIAELKAELKGQIDRIPMDDDLKRTLAGTWNFIQVMGAKLTEAYRGGKSGWEEASPHYLLSRLIEESAELVEASSEYRMIGLLSGQLRDLSKAIMGQEAEDGDTGKDEEPVFRENIFQLANGKAIAKEAIDIANFAYFIWARCQNKEYWGGRTEDKEDKS